MSAIAVAGSTVFNELNEFVKVVGEFDFGAVLRNGSDVVMNTDRQVVFAGESADTR